MATQSGEVVTGTEKKTRYVTRMVRAYNASDEIAIDTKYTTGRMRLMGTQQSLLQGAANKADEHSTYKIRDNNDLFAVPVILKSDVGNINGGNGALTRDLVWCLSVIDLRIRTLGAPLLRNMHKRLNNAKYNQLESKIDIPYWDAMYIPSISVNPRYSWMNLRRISDNASSDAPEVGGVSLDVFAAPSKIISLGRVKKLLWGNGGLPVKIQFIGNTIVTSQPSGKHFVILWIDDAEIADPPSGFFDLAKNIFLGRGTPSGKVAIIGEKSADFGAHDDFRVLFDQASLRSTEAIAQMKSAIEGGGYDDKDQLLAEVDFACDALKAFDGYTANAFLPVIINSDIAPNIITANAFTGYPFTLMDVAHLSSIYFTGNLAHPKDKKVDTEDHANGNAIDLSVVPFYVHTGLKLKETPELNPLGPFNSSKLVSNSRELAPASDHMIATTRKANIKVQDKKITNMLEVPIKSTSKEGHDGPGAEDDIKSLFDSHLSGNRVLDGHFKFNPLASGGIFTRDKKWYHITANRVSTVRG